MAGLMTQLGPKPPVDPSLQFHVTKPGRAPSITDPVAQKAAQIARQEADRVAPPLSAATPAFATPQQPARTGLMGGAPGSRIPAPHTPATVQMSPETSVSDRVTNLLGQENDYLRSAGTRAKQFMNRRGLLNSTLTAEAVEKARIDASLPIAQADARTAAEFRLANQGATNRAQEMTQQGQIESALMQERGGIDQQLQTADAANRERLLNRQGEIDTELQGMRQTHETGLLNRRAEIDTEMQTADFAGRSRLMTEQAQIDTELQGMRQTHETGLLNRRAEIDTEMQTADFAGRSRLMTEQAGIDMQIESFRSDRAVEQIEQRGQIQSRLQQERGEIDSELATAEGARRKELLGMQAANNLNRDRLNNAARLQQIATEYSGRARVQKMQNAFQSGESEKDRLARETIQNRQAVINKEFADADGVRRTELMQEKSRLDQEMQALQSIENEASRTHDTEMKNLISKHEALLAKNRTAADFVASYNSEISHIDMDPNMSPEGKTAAREAAKSSMNANLDFLDALGYTDTEEEEEAEPEPDAVADPRTPIQ